jgi:hypothetical protein
LGGIEKHLRRSEVRAALLLVLSPLQAAAFALVHQGLFGLDLGCSFAPQPQGHAHPSEADEFDFLRRQILTSRNVRGSRFVDTLLGGLNYQIEHHLFPSMPGPTCATPNPWSGSSACATTSPTPKPPCSAPTPRPSATSTPSAPHCAWQRLQLTSVARATVRT